MSEIIFVVERLFCYKMLLKENEIYPVFTDDSGTWYPQAYKFLKLKPSYSCLLLKKDIKGNAVHFL